MTTYEKMLYLLNPEYFTTEVLGYSVEAHHAEVGISNLQVHHIHYVVALEHNDDSKNWKALCRPCQKRRI